jgi:hypothetical protein
MRFAAAAFLLVLSHMAPAADWRDTLTVRKGRTPPLRPLTAEYDFGWGGLKAAEATAKFTHPKKQFRLELGSKTVGLARTIWRMDTTASSSVNAATLKPVKLVQVEKYSNKTLTTTVNFSTAGVARLKVETPADKNRAKVKRFKFGQVYDMHSALLFIRSQPLRKGDTIRLCVYPDTSPYLAEITVTDREEVTAAGKKWPAIACDLKLREITKDYTLIAHDKFKKATVWLSDDPDRLLLKLETDVFIGKVWAELKKVEFAPKK